MESCRCVWIPRRVVSGFQFMYSPANKCEFHAWTEVFIPGFGWKGFNPGGCGLINHNYITLASSFGSELVAPVRVGFMGPANTNSELE